MDRLIKSFSYQGEIANKCPQYIEGYQLVYVITGSVKFAIGSKEYNIESPALVMLSPFEKYIVEYASDEYMRFTMVINSLTLENELDPRISSMLKYRPKNFDHVLIFDRDTSFLVNRIFACINDELSSKYEFKEKMLNFLVAQLLIIIYRNGKHEKSENYESIIAIQKFVDSKYSTITDIHDLAVLFGISSSHLSHSFKSITGYSPKEYLTHTRLHHAQQYLTYTDLNIKTICKLIGYTDLNNFIRQFRIKYAMPPLQFRKRHSKLRA